MIHHIYIHLINNKNDRSNLIHLQELFKNLNKYFYVKASNNVLEQTNDIYFKLPDEIQFELNDQIILYDSEIIINE